jgi:23S rRNA pseudouridine2605 synthase
MPASEDKKKIERPLGTGRKSLEGSVRIARFLAACGVGSRRACETLIDTGRITVNGRVIDSPATQVDIQKDKVCFGRRQLRLHTAVYLMLNKPRGYTCSADDPHAQHLVFELLPTDRGRLFTVGRLDRDSEGLLIVTNDGEFAQRLAHPRYQVAKTYRVQVEGEINGEILRKMEEGIYDEGERLRAQTAKVRKIGHKPLLELVITEGKKREVRRMCAHFGLKVMRLTRIQLGKVRLGGLKPGEWGTLTPAELRSLQESSTPAAAPKKQAGGRKRTPGRT